MTEKEIQQLNYINMFLNAIANSTNEILNHKYNCCVSHQMNLIYIGSGQSGDGIDLLNQYFLCKRKCNRIGYIYTNTFQDIYIPELSERGISMNKFYNVQNIQWAIDGDIDFKSSISQWFIKPDGGFHKATMNALCEQLSILINGRKFELSELYYPLGCLHYGKWIDNCYYLLLRVENNDMDSSLVSKSAGGNQ